MRERGVGPQTKKKISDIYHYDQGNERKLMGRVGNKGVSKGMGP
jgi:hypothetical protein